MKRLLLILICILTITTQAWASCENGSWKAGDTCTFYFQNNGAGGEEDCSSLPTYRVYEDEVGTPVTTGTMALLDDSNTVGFYSEALSLDGAWAEKGKSYIVRARCPGTTYALTVAVQIEAEVDSNTVSGTVPTVTTVTNAVTLPTIPADWITAGGIQASAITSSEAPNLDTTISSRLAPTVAGRTVDITVGGTVGVDFNNTEGTVSATLEDDAITAAKIAAAAITPSEAPNLDVAVSSRSTLVTTDNIGVNFSDISGTLDASEIGADAITDAKVADALENRLGWIATVDLTGNTGTWDLSLNAEGVSVTDQFKGMILSCGNESREIVASTTGTPDHIKTEPFNIWPAAPTSSTCVVRAK